MIGSMRLAQTASLCSTRKACPSVVISQISSTCGMPAPRKMKKSALVQTRDHGKKARTQVRMNTVSYIALKMNAGPERTKSSFASRLRLRRECNRSPHSKEKTHEINFQHRRCARVGHRALHKLANSR